MDIIIGSNLISILNNQKKNEKSFFTFHMEKIINKKVFLKKLNEVELNNIILDFTNDLFLTRYNR